MTKSTSSTSNLNCRERNLFKRMTFAIKSKKGFSDPKQINSTIFQENLLFLHHRARRALEAYSIWVSMI